MERVWGAPDLLRLAGVLALSLLFFGLSARRRPPVAGGPGQQLSSFSLVDRRGHASGFDLEVAEELCRAMGRQCEFVFLPLDGLLESMRNGGLDLLLGVSETDGRREFMDFSKPIFARVPVISAGPATWGREGRRGQDRRARGQRADRPSSKPPG